MARVEKAPEGRVSVLEQKIIGHISFEIDQLSFGLWF